MVRKTKEESDKTRLSILNTALTIFFEKGYARTTLDDIANACGITRGKAGIKKICFILKMPINCRRISIESGLL